MNAGNCAGVPRASPRRRRVTGGVREVTSMDRVTRLQMKSMKLRSV